MGEKSRGNFPHYPNPKYACERCLFKTGQHTCPLGIAREEPQGMAFEAFDRLYAEDRFRADVDAIVANRME